MIALLLALTAGCQTTPPRAQHWVRTELYFGLSEEGHGISQAQWQSFLDRQVTPRFPDGLSVVDVAGQWKGESGQITREPSKLLILLHPPDGAIDKQIDELRAIYRRQFHQESVLRTDEPASVEF
jgi:hypothetical protein